MEKGNELEDAVKLIERMILEDSPNLAKDAFEIKGKKIVTVAGVRHEYDVWVEIDHGSEYRSLFVFECKNWEGSVGKNEVIIFSEKVSAVQAQKGFIAAKAFTKDARAQADTDPRLILLDVTEFDVANISLPFQFHFLLREDSHGELNIQARQQKSGNDSFTKKVKLEKTVSTLNSESVDIAAYTRDWINVCMDQYLESFPSVETEDGPHDLETSDERTFEDGELIIDDMVVETLRIGVRFRVRIVRPAVLSHYEVATRGRILSFAPVQVGEKGHVQAKFLGKY